MEETKKSGAGLVSLVRGILNKDECLSGLSNKKLREAARTGREHARAFLVDPGTKALLLSSRGVNATIALRSGRCLVMDSLDVVVQHMVDHVYENSGEGHAFNVAQALSFLLCVSGAIGFGADVKFVGTASAMFDSGGEMLVPQVGDIDGESVRNLVKKVRSMLHDVVARVPRAAGCGTTVDALLSNVVPYYLGFLSRENMFELLKEDTCVAGNVEWDGHAITFKCKQSAMRLALKSREFSKLEGDSKNLEMLATTFLLSMLGGVDEMELCITSLASVPPVGPVEGK